MIDASAILETAKMALRVTTDAYDDEIASLIESAQLDMNVAGVEVPEALDGIINTAVVTYVKLHFGDPDNYDRLKASYDEQKAQLVTCTGYTDWLDED